MIHVSPFMGVDRPWTQRAMVILCRLSRGAGLAVNRRNRFSLRTGAEAYRIFGAAEQAARTGGRRQRSPREVSMVRIFAHAALAVAIFVVVVPGAASADEIADFYRGKRMTILISTPAGTGYDTYARLLVRNLPAHIPGTPSIVPQNMPGAGGMTLLNQAYANGARDGTLLFTLHFTLPLYQAMGGRGVRYDAGKLIGLGRLLASNAVIGVGRDAKADVHTLADALQREAVIGSTGVSSNATIYPTILNNMLGTKFKIVSGYAGENAIFLAMERGEVDGFGSYSYLTFKATKPDYLTKKLFYPIVQWGAKREREWSDVPTAIDAATTPTDKRAMELASAGPDIGFSYFMPPAVPAARVRALRAAFQAMIGDAAFIAEAKRLNLPLRTASGPEMEAIVRNVLSAPPAVINRLTELMATKGGILCQDFTKAEFCAKGGGN
jgi:tripartite-type tricarboxylate transporter receptor subunit TctC